MLKMGLSFCGKPLKELADVAFVDPKSIKHHRNLTCKDFFDNAKAVFENKI